MGQARWTAPTRSAACDRGVAGGAGLVLGQRPVGGPEPQRQGQRLAALPDLRTGVDVEQPHVLEQLTGARRGPRRPPPAAATSSATIRLTSWNTAGNGDTRGAGSVSAIGIASRFEFHRAGALRQAGALDDRGVQLPGVADGRPPRRTPRRTGPDATAGRCAARRVTSTPAARPMTRTASKASAASTGRPGPHGPAGSRRPVSTTPTCCGWRGSDASSVAISSSVGRRSVGMRSTARVSSVAHHHLRDREQRGVDRCRGTRCATNASSSPGSSVVASCGRSASSGLSTVAVRATRDRRRPDPRCRTPRQAGTGSAGSRRSRCSASDFPIGRRRFCTAVSPRPAGRQRQHRRDDVETLEPQHLLDQVGGLAQIGTPTRRLATSRSVSAVGHSVTAAPIWVSRRAVTPRRVAHAGGAVGQIDRHADRGR